jgi:hypothetical protein
MCRGMPFCLWETRGERRRGPDLWDFCGASGRAAQPLDDGSKSCRCQSNLGSPGYNRKRLRELGCSGLCGVTEELQMPGFDDALRGYAYPIHKRDGFRCRYCGLNGTQSFAQ